MKKLLSFLKKESILVIDLEKNEFEIGWLWVIIQIPTTYLMIRDWLV
jgi:hypothetical protein